MCPRGLISPMRPISFICGRPQGPCSYGRGYEKGWRVAAFFYSAPMSLQRARETLELMLGHLGLVFEVEEMEPAGRHVLNIHSREAGRLIGRDGHVLEDLQYLLNRILSRTDAEAPNVIIDVEGYRQKEKQDFLGRIRELADEVRRTGRPMVLAPMNSFDRRLVHQAFAEDPEIATHSEEGSARLKQITLALRSSSGSPTET